MVGIIEIQSLSKFDVNTRLLSIISFLFSTSHFFTAQSLMWKVQAALDGGRGTRTRAFGRKRCLPREQFQSASLKVLVGRRMFRTGQQIIHSTRLSLAWRRKWLPTPLFLLGGCHGQRSLVSSSPRGSRGGLD